MNTDSLQSKLEELIGVRARIWSYTATHDRLTIELVALDSPKWLQFIFCEKISAPTFWKIAAPMLTVKDKERVIFRDQDVEIVCQEVVLEG